MSNGIPRSHHTVNEVMHAWPETVWLFLDYGMSCAGCPVGAFHTVEEAALEYRIPLHRFLSELRTVAVHGYRRRTRAAKSPASRPRRLSRGKGAAKPSSRH